MGKIEQILWCLLIITSLSALSLSLSLSSLSLSSSFEVGQKRGKYFQDDPKILKMTKNFLHHSFCMTRTFVKLNILNNRHLLFSLSHINIFLQVIIKNIKLKCQRVISKTLLRTIPRPHDKNVARIIQVVSKF